jgi:hypothetical protein
MSRRQIRRLACFLKLCSTVQRKSCESTRSADRTPTDRMQAGRMLIFSGLLRTSALKTFVKRVDRSKSQFGGGVHVGNAWL